ncbi:bifunctional (p)ppGpp synthetase/guanosine-3',5'-bis(diphosphate) 3'-pyrophosphohydrolase [bacterium SCSIO 12741]|nr:bifunctional (p)ppGpp synthetase/guanosine-3',5'-bis(diphosphate) 3'-pyrophosphohydrolase [bacterium SCSIO 12741]
MTEEYWQELERKEKTAILRAYRSLLKPGKVPVSEEDSEELRKAFDVALEAHSGVRRKSGEPYIYHPLEVAKIVKEDIGLDTTGIVCALLHDVVEDSNLTVGDIHQLFGKKVASIIDGLTKISEIFDQNTNLQAENFKKLILTLSQDVRVILIKLADRLHNMRTLESMREDKRRKIASETMYLYAPLAHRLGLYNIKSEMEDLSLKYIEPEAYEEIKYKLQKSKAVRTRFLNQFVLPIERELTRAGLKYKIVGRTKSIHSIYQKMKRQNVPFEEVFDILAVRIILDSPREQEKADCWKTYSVVTDFYKPNPDRLRDWISTPKATMYESLHITVMSPTGKWVEVQIRSERMDEIAENGYAAHWKYKGEEEEHIIDKWIGRIRESIENTESDSEDFLNEFRLHLFEDEILVFTPKGDVISLPAKSTPVDFAFEIHTQVGNTCIGAKVNNRLVRLSKPLKSGDQVEIITSEKGHPEENWLKFVRTAKAKSKVKDFLKAEKKKLAGVGRSIVRRELRERGIKNTNNNLYKIAYFYNLPTLDELFFQAKAGKLKWKNLDKLNIDKGQIKDKFRKTKNTIITNVGGKAEYESSNDKVQNVEYKLAPCCNPIPGDKVFGFIGETGRITIHRTNCPKAVEMQSHKHYRVIEAKWTSQKDIAFLVGINMTGIDRVGIVHYITSIVSQDMNVNMRSINFESVDGVFTGEIRAYVTDTNHLNALIKKIGRVKGIETVVRIDASN